MREKVECVEKVAKGCELAKRGMCDDAEGVAHSGYQEAMVVQTVYK